MSEETLLGTLYKLLPGINKLLSGVGILVVLVAVVLPQLTGATNSEVPFTPVADLIRPENHSEGKQDATVTMIEFLDFQCPFCAQIDPTVTQIKTEYKDRVRFVTKMYPLDQHSNAKSAAYSAMAAKNQGKFNEYKDKLFAAQDNPGLGFRTQENIAKELGLDMDRWSKDRVSDEIKNIVETDKKDGETARIPVTEGSTELTSIDGTPKFVYLKNGKIMYQSGVLPADEFRKNLDKLLSE